MNEEHVATKCDHVTWAGKEDKTQEIYEHVVYIKKIVLINVQRKIQGKIHCETLKISTSLHTWGGKKKHKKFD